MNRDSIWYKLAYPVGILLPWILTPFVFFIASFIPKANLPLLYLTMVVFFAINVTLELALINALSSFFAFSFFFADPYGSIMIHHNEDLLMIIIFLLVSLLVGYIATQHKQNVQKIRIRELMTDIELELLEKLPKALNTQEVVDAMREALKPWKENCVLITKGDKWATHPMIRRLTHMRKTNLEDLLELRLTPEVINDIPSLQEQHDVYFLYNSKQVIGLLKISISNIQYLPKDIFLLLLHQVNISLERTRLSADLEKEKIAKENELLRSALLSSVSHDFRTPLTSMIGATSTVIELGEHLDKQQTRELLETVLEEAQRLNRYTQNLLDMTRLGFGQLQLECNWVTLEEIISAVKKRLKPLLTQNELKTEIDPDLPSLYVQSAFIEQAIFNIIDNAIKFSPPNASIDVYCRKEGEQIFIEICDHGPGIPEEEREKVFERFHTADKGDRRRSGSGLGLTICQGMIMAHGGKVSIHANTQKSFGRSHPGCCVRIELPIIENPEEKNPDPLLDPASNE
jgi:two-component system, OmpR family, sensor histidine kinase KdpD